MMMLQFLAKTVMIGNSRWPPCPYMVKIILTTSLPVPPGRLIYILHEAYGAPLYIK